MIKVNFHLNEIEHGLVLGIVLIILGGVYMLIDFVSMVVVMKEMKRSIVACSLYYLTFAVVYFITRYNITGYFIRFLFNLTSGILMSIFYKMLVIRDKLPDNSIINL